jgi:hypothetical protein
MTTLGRIPSIRVPLIKIGPVLVCSLVVVFCLVVVSWLPLIGVAGSGSVRYSRWEESIRGIAR